MTRLEAIDAIAKRKDLRIVIGIQSADEIKAEHDGSAYIALGRLRQLIAENGLLPYEKWMEKEWEDTDDDLAELGNRVNNILTIQMERMIASYMSCVEDPYVEE